MSELRSGLAEGTDAVPGEFECGCCHHCHAQARLGGWIGVGGIQPICLECYWLFLAVRWNFPDGRTDELLDSARVLRAIEEMSIVQQQQLQRLVFLTRNRSRRAARLVAMAIGDQISVAQLLSIV